MSVGVWLRNGILVFAVLLWMASVSPMSGEGLANGLIFYLPFDGEVDAFIAAGNPTEMAEGIEVAFVEGKVGKGVHCGGKGKHRYLAYLVRSPHFPPNIRPEAGTVALWVRPDWDGNEEAGDRYRHFLSIRSGLFYLYWHRGVLTFSSTSRQLAKHLYQPSASVTHWKAGEWHHVAITWERNPTTQRGTKRLYVDGQLVGEAKGVLLDFDLSGALIVGGLDAAPERIADATIDEFAIWKRALSGEEIRQLWAWGNEGKPLADWPGVRDLARATQQRRYPSLPPQRGNLLSNASFEVGALHPWRASNMTLRPDPKTKVHGFQSARFTASGTTVLTSGLFVARPGVPHTFSFYLRAGHEGGEVRFGVYSAYVAGTEHERYAPRWRGIEEKGTLTTTWRRYTVSGALPPSPGGYYFVRLAMQTPTDTSIWVDAMQVEEGERATPFRPRRRWEAGLATERPFHVFHPDEPVRVQVSLFAEGDVPPTIPLTLTVRDLWEREVARRTITMTPRSVGILPMNRERATPTTSPSAAKAAMEVLLRLPLGSYRLSLVDAEGTMLDELVVSVLPRFTPRGKATSMSIHVPATEEGVRLARLLGCGWVRILDASGVTHWDVVEPQPGQWTWERSNWLDEAINTYRRGGLHILGLLFRSPLWASSGDTVNHPPKDLAAWRTYVRSVAEHFRGRIEAYEVWNEPYGFFEGREDLYVQMVRIAREEIRQADPDALIVAPCTYWQLEQIVKWTEDLLERDLLSFTDVFSFHGYEGVRPDDFARIWAWARRDGQACPFWNTEHGVASRSFYRFLPDAYDDPYTRWLGMNVPTAREAAAKLVKGYVSTLAAGGEKFFQYWAVPEDTLLPRLRSLSLLEFDNALCPKAVAWAIAGWLLDGSRPLGVERRDNLLMLRFEREGRPLTVLWCESGTARVPIPPGHRALTMMGTPMRTVEGTVLVGEEVVYFVPSNLIGG